MDHRRRRGEARAQGRDALVKDVLAPGLRVLFVGINPGTYSAAVGHNFARPGNRFWPALHAAGITPERIDPAEERRLLGLGVGITNIVARTTASADELSREELRAGARTLRRKIARLRPRCVAFLGLGAYRTAFEHPKASIGEQEPMAGARVWVLPNPSGLNAHYQLDALAALFAEMWAMTAG